MIEKPRNDHRLYRHVTLANKMEAIVVSDSACDKASCSMAVRIGSLFDPPEVPGLAHFCEHMLFLGTEKYPAEDSYNEHLAKHGGHSNAYTAGTQTVYYFSCAPDALEDSVDRFAQFFVSPLFTPSATDREINAVNSEHLKNQQSDTWRMMQLQRNSANPKHPLNRFSTGNIDTLKLIPEKNNIDIRQGLLDFHEKWYSSNEMRLAVLGKGTLDELEAMVRVKFEEVKNKETVIPRGEAIGGGEVPVLPSTLKTRLTVVPVRDTRSVSFLFMLPEQTDNWETKPWRYFSHLVGHEGQGSVLSLLKKKGLATELSAGPTMDEAGLCVFGIEVQLTEQGDTDEGIFVVGESLFSYIRMLSENPIQESIWEEMRNIEEINFMFRSLPDPVSCSIALSTALHTYPVEKVFSAPYRLWKYEPEGISKLMGYFTCDNMRLVVVSKRYAKKCIEIDQWYGTEHLVEPIPLEWLDPWKECRIKEEEMIIPPINPFIPTDLSLRPPQGQIPPVPRRFQVPNCHVYHRQDEIFKLPKTILGFIFYSPFTSQSCKNAVLTEFFCQAVMEELNEYAYDAEIAGLGYELSSDPRGFGLEVKGYNHKVGEIMEAIAKKIKSMDYLEQKTFDIVHARMLRDLQNAATKRQPYSQAISNERRLLSKPFFLFTERLVAFSEIRIEDFVGINERLFGSRFGECLVQGNTTQEEASKLFDDFFSILPPVKTPMEEVPRVEVAKLEKDVHMCIKGSNDEEKNGASIVSLQVGEDAIELATMVSLATQILSQRFYDDLRTKQQFGYIVALQSARSAGKCLEMNYIIQTEKPVWEATKKILQFIDESTAVLEGLSQEDFETYRSALLTLLEEKPKKLIDEWGRNWSAIRDRNFNFHRKEQQAEFLRQLKREDFNKFAQQLAACKKVTSEICAAQHWDQRPEGPMSTAEELYEFAGKQPHRYSSLTQIENDAEISRL